MSLGSDACVVKMRRSYRTSRLAQSFLTGRAALLPKPLSSRMLAVLLIIHISTSTGFQQSAQSLGTHPAQGSALSFKSTQGEDSAAFVPPAVVTSLDSNQHAPATTGSMAATLQLLGPLEPLRRLLQVLFTILPFLLIVPAQYHLQGVCNSPILH